MPYNTLFINDKCHSSHRCQTHHPLANSIGLESHLVYITENGVLMKDYLSVPVDIENLTELTHRQFLFLNERFLLFDRIWTDTDNLNFTRLKDVLLLTIPVNIFQTIIEMNIAYLRSHVGTGRLLLYIHMNLEHFINRDRRKERKNAHSYLTLDKRKEQ